MSANVVQLRMVRGRLVATERTEEVCRRDQVNQAAEVHVRLGQAGSPSDGAIGGLVGNLDVLRVECLTCGRQGRYRVARLLEELGPGYRLTDWLHERTRDCPQKNQAGVTRACGAIMPDLVDLP
jgi:hypothetical protein